MVLFTQGGHIFHRILIIKQNTFEFELEIKFEFEFLFEFQSRKNEKHVPQFDITQVKLQFKDCNFSCLLKMHHKFVFASALIFQ